MNVFVEFRSDIPLSTSKGVYYPGKNNHWQRICCGHCTNAQFAVNEPIAIHHSLGELCSWDQRNRREWMNSINWTTRLLFRFKVEMLPALICFGTDYALLQLRNGLSLKSPCKLHRIMFTYIVFHLHTSFPQKQSSLGNTQTYGSLCVGSGNGLTYKHSCYLDILKSW